jgi:hypothetical protein
MWMRLGLLFCVSALPVRAESPIAEVICAPRAEMVDRLTVRMGSRVAATGIRDIEAVIEVWTAPSGQWTMVQTYTDGQSCIVAMGEAWDMAAAMPEAG